MEQLWTVQCLSALLLDAIPGAKEEIWGHKDSVLCLQITPPALRVVRRDLIASFYLNSIMALGLHHSSPFPLVFPHPLNPIEYF